MSLVLLCSFHYRTLVCVCFIELLIGDTMFVYVCVFVCRVRGGTVLATYQIVYSVGVFLGIMLSSI